MIAGFENMIAKSLDLEEPWYIRGAEFNSEKNTIDIYVGIRENAIFSCPKCGGTTIRYGYESNERTWRHADCMFFPTFVHCRRPKVKCDNCGIMQINAPFERPNSRFTLSFEGYAMLIMANMPRRSASKLLRCNEKSLASILSYWVNKAVDETDLNDIKRMAIDETSFKRGHEYVTVAIDSEKRRVFDVEPGRSKESVEMVKEFLEQHGGNAENIDAVTSDMSVSYLPGVRENFPNAEQIIDKFHVKQTLINAMDKVRKAEQKSTKDKKTLFRGRYLFMKPIYRMTEEQYAKLTTLSKSYPKTGRAFRMVQALDEFYDSDTITEANTRFDQLCSWMRRSRLEPMKTAALTLKAHKLQIMNYHHNKLTNAICEGINSMIQAAKRKARGYNTYDGFRSMIFLIAGKLKLAVKYPF